MLHPLSSTSWLSDEMAHALAAMSPPLNAADIVQAAGGLAAGDGAVKVLNQLLRQGADLMTVRQVVEALHALRDARVSDSSLAAWLLARERTAEVDASGLLLAAERVYRKLAPPLSRLISPAGIQALLARSLYVARAEFPFLDAARAGAQPDACLLGLSERMHEMDAARAADGLEATLGILLDLLVGFIGEDLTLNLIRGVWPDLPITAMGPPEALHSQGANQP